MRRFARIAAVLSLALLPASLAACGGGTEGSDASVQAAEGGATIVVTYSILGSVVEELVGDEAQVTVIMPNGADPHEYQPSAKDVEAMTKADLIVQNGLSLEEGLGDAIVQAVEAGVPTFLAADHVDVRIVGEGEGAEPDDPDQQPGARDPHLWMDPLAMKAVVEALAPVLDEQLGLDVADRAAELERRLDELNAADEETLAGVPADHRKLVTGHESMGYFARRYDFELVGAIIPGLSTQAQSSASELADLEAKIEAAGVPAIFTELGTSPDVAQAVGDETGAEVVEIGTHSLPDDGSYFTFMRDVSGKVAGALD